MPQCHAFAFSLLRRCCTRASVGSWSPAGRTLTVGDGKISIGEYVTRLIDRAATFRGHPSAVRPRHSPHPHRTRAAHAEQVHRELQWQVPRRMPERPLVPDAAPGETSDRRFEVGLQRGASRQQHWPHRSGSVFCATSPGESMMQPSPATRSTSSNLSPGDFTIRLAWPKGQFRRPRLSLPAPSLFLVKSILRGR